jgi:hypothetical protein
MAIVRPFEMEVWLAVLIAILLMGPTYWTFLQHGPEDVVTSMNDAVLDVVKCIVTQGEY